MRTLAAEAAARPASRTEPAGQLLVRALFWSGTRGCSQKITHTAVLARESLLGGKGVDVQILCVVFDVSPMMACSGIR